MNSASICARTKCWINPWNITNGPWNCPRRTKTCFTTSPAYTWKRKILKKTVACLLTTLELNPTLEAGLKFLQWMKDKGLVTPDQTEAVDAALAKGQGQRPADAAGA
jgi:hypothetical protein